MRKLFELKTFPGWVLDLDSIAYIGAPRSTLSLYCSNGLYGFEIGIKGTDKPLEISLEFEEKPDIWDETKVNRIPAIDEEHSRLITAWKGREYLLDD